MNISKPTEEIRFKKKKHALKLKDKDLHSRGNLWVSFIFYFYFCFTPTDIL